MPTKLKRVVLDNRIEVACLSEIDAKVVYEKSYLFFKHGIELHPGDVVFDLGANIGVISLLIYEKCQRDATVYAFEPIPAIFEVLKQNAQRVDPDKIKVFPYGVSKESGSMIFTYYPQASLFSTLYPIDSEEEREEVRKSVMAEQSSTLSPRFFRLLPPFLRSMVLDIGLRMVFRGKPVTCEMVTLSQFIRQHAIERVDLLKLNVERSELDVFLGIEDQDWPKIKQVSMHVHRDGLMDDIVALLEKHGFRTRSETNPVMQSMQVCMLYATRS